MRLFNERVLAIEKLWRDNITEMVKSFSAEVATYAQSIRHSQEEINGQLQAYAQVRETVREASVLVKDGQSRLERAFVDLEGEQKSARTEVVAALKARVDGIESSLMLVSDNEMLSIVRAYVFRDALMKAIRSSVEFAELARKIDSGEIRIYTIGVGDKEPVRAGSLAENRRIEIRFAHDRVQGNTP